MHGRWPVHIGPVTAAGWRWFLLRIALFLALVMMLPLGLEKAGVDPDRQAGVHLAAVLGMATAFIAYLIPAMLRQARRIDTRDPDR